MNFMKDQSDSLQESPELKSQIDGQMMVQIPIQASRLRKDIKIIQRNVLKGTLLPVTIKEIQAYYLSSPYFKDICLHLAQNKLPLSKAAITRTKILAERYLLLNSLLFRKTPEVFAIPENCADRLIALYIFSSFGGHQGVIKTDLIMIDKFYIPDLIHHPRTYIKSFHMSVMKD